MTELLTSARYVSQSVDNFIFLLLSFSSSLFLPVLFSSSFFLLFSFSHLPSSAPSFSFSCCLFFSSSLYVFFSHPFLLLSCPFLSLNPHLSYCRFLFCSFLSSRKAITSTYFPRSDAILLKDFYDNIITSKLFEFDSNSSLSAIVNSGINGSTDGYGRMNGTSSIIKVCHQ